MRKHIQTVCMHLQLLPTLSPLFTIKWLYNYIFFGRNRIFLQITFVISRTQGIPSESGQNLEKKQVQLLRKLFSLILFCHSFTDISLSFHLLAQHQIQTNLQSSSQCHIPIWLLCFLLFSLLNKDFSLIPHFICCTSFNHCFIFSTNICPSFYASAHNYSRTSGFRFPSSSPTCTKSW